MAYIRKLRSGKFNAVVYLPNGKRKSLVTDPLKRVVEARAREFELARDHGSALPLRDRKLTVGQWHGKWVKARRVEPNTAAKNDSHWRNHIEPRWGTWPLSAIDRLDVQTWVNDMVSAGAGATTVAACYHLLSKMLADAVLSKKLAASPCVGIDLPTVVQPPARWLAKDEYGRIQIALGERTLRVSRTDRELPDPLRLQWQAYVALGCYSGLRCPGELAGLDVEHVDLQRQLVHVQQVLTREGMRAYPKTHGSNRWVPFPPEVGYLLWRLMGDRGQGPVFVSPTGKRVNEANFRNRVWRSALAAAGVKYVDPYTMRHTAASWLVQAGVPTFEIVKLLGHSSQRLVNLYAHLAPDQHDRIRLAWGEGASDSQPTSNPRPVVRFPVEL